MQINVQADIREVTKFLNKLEKQQVPKAAARALNKTSVTVKSRMAKALSRRTGLKQKTVRAALEQFKATWRKLTATLIAQGKPLNLRAYGARQTRKGVTANAWGTRRLYPGTFEIQKFGRRVYKRTGKARLPIKQVWGPGIAKSFIAPVATRMMRMIVNKEFPKNFARELKYYLSRAR